MHRRARNQYPAEGTEEASGNGRFHESGEIYYNIASVIKYAPFIRRIFIVTDGQKPSDLDFFFNEGLCDRSFVRLVSHDEIFDGLVATRPNFNSLSIEAAIWRIPGLSEKFIYSNDDFFLNTPLSSETFFAGDLPVLGGRWAQPDRKRLKTRAQKVLRKLTGLEPSMHPSYRKSLQRGAEVAGVMDRFLIIEHHPHPLRRSTFERFFSSQMDILNRQIRYRYRSVEQFNPVSLAYHLEVSKHGVVPGPAKDVAYLKPSMGRRVFAGMERIRSGSAPFGCIQNFERFPASLAGEMHKILTEKFCDTLPSKIAEKVKRRASLAA